MGIALHWFTAAIQWQQIVFPEFGYGFRQVNATDLEGALFRVERLLGLHLAATSALCLALAAALLSPGPRIRAIEAGLCAVKVLHIAVCALAFHSFPGHVVWLVIFTAEAVCLHGWLRTMSYSSNLAMSVGSVAFATGLACAEVVGLGGASLIKTYTYGIGSIWLGRAAERNERVMWLQQWVLGAEQRLFREKLFDLLPPSIASRRIELEAGSLPPPERMVAVVLQVTPSPSPLPHNPLHITGAINPGPELPRPVRLVRFELIDTAPPAAPRCAELAFSLNSLEAHLPF